MAKRGFPTRSEILVLQILQDSPKGLSGPDIVKRGIKEGSVYVLLMRLEDKGFIDVNRSSSEYPGLHRSNYKINPEGRRVLRYAGELDAIPAMT